MLSEEQILSLLVRSFSGDRKAYSDLLSWLQEHSLKQLKVGLQKYHNFPQELMLDITQDIMISFHQTHQTFDISRPFLPWINSMIRYKTIDFIRRKDFRVIMSGIDIESIKKQWIEDNDTNSLEAGELFKSLDSLPEKQAQILKLSKIEGYSNKEIASELKMTESNVKVTIFRSLKFLKKIVADPKK